MDLRALQKLARFRLSERNTERQQRGYEQGPNDMLHLFLLPALAGLPDLTGLPVVTGEFRNVDARRNDLVVRRWRADPAKAAAITRRMGRSSIREVL